MPIIIWGSRGLTSHLDRGKFYCPACECESEYALDQVREWFTIYFIPIFPVGSAQRYVECQRCGQAFTEEVFAMKPPSEGERMMAHLYRDLEEGRSLEDVEDELKGTGMDRERAHKMAGEIAGEALWRCETCGEHYITSVRTCRRCKRV